MKKRMFNYLCYVLIIAPFLLTSCGSEEPEENNLAPATEESSKEKIREDGISVVQSMEEMRDVSAIQALETLLALALVEEEVEDISAGARIGVFVAENIVTGTSEEGQVSTIGIASVSLEEDEDFDEEETLEDLWAEAKGTYTYNSAIDDFDFVEGGDAIVVLFPLEETGTENNVNLTISNFTSQAPSTDAILEDLEYDGNLPTSIDASLKIDDVEQMSYSLSASYDGNDSPTSVATSLVLNPFSINISFSNDGSTAQYSYDLKEGEDVIFANSASVSGNVGYNQLASLEDEEDVRALDLNDISYIYQIENTKISVSIDSGEGLIDDLLDIDEDLEESDPETFHQEIEDVFNKHVIVSAVFVDTNQKIADASVDVYEPIDDEDDGFDIILTYDDGTKVAIDDFIDASFDGIENDLEALFDDLEESFEDEV